QMLKKFALGADITSSARGMMLALGCIQALRCHTDHCPVGVATTNPRLYKGLNVPSKAERVASFQEQTIVELRDLVQSSGATCVADISKNHIFRRVVADRIKSFEEIYPTIETGTLLKEEH